MKIKKSKMGPNEVRPEFGQREAKAKFGEIEVWKLKAG